MKYILTTTIVLAIAVLATFAVTANTQGIHGKMSGSACTKDYRPVCGVNGITYGNSCMAGPIEIAHEGECEMVLPVEPEGCLTGACDIPQTPESADNGAVRACTMDYNPVCGVDGITYSNACSAGDVAIAHPGECAR